MMNILQLIKNLNLPQQKIVTQLYLFGKWMPMSCAELQIKSTIKKDDFIIALLELEELNIVSLSIING